MKKREACRKSNISKTNLKNLDEFLFSGAVQVAIASFFS